MVLHYWKDQQKWRKITKAIKENKISVIRGNLGYSESNKVLIEILQKNPRDITLDMSNIAEYIKNKVQLEEAIKAIAATTPTKHMTILATDQAGKMGPSLQLFALGNEEKISLTGYYQCFRWTYYYFPNEEIYCSCTKNAFNRSIERSSNIIYNETIYIAGEQQINDCAFLLAKLLEENIPKAREILRNFPKYYGFNIANEDLTLIYKKVLENYIQSMLEERDVEFSDDTNKPWTERIIEALRALRDHLSDQRH